MIVGGGHNALTCAAYLARGGLSVTVLEKREVPGGACSREEFAPGFAASPCAYLAGLLHPTVIEELELSRRGLRWTPAEQGLFVPFDDGSYVQLYDDGERCESEIARIAPEDLDGFRAMTQTFADLRRKLRPPGEEDLWLQLEPTRQWIESRLGPGEDIGRRILFEWSMHDLLSHFLSNEHLIQAYLGQGVIGTNASPFDPGTAYIHFHHSCGTMFGKPGTWGYVTGGIGRVSMLLAEAVREAGGAIQCGAEVVGITPGELFEVELASAERLLARQVVSGADPIRTMKLLGSSAPDDWKQKAAGWQSKGCTLKMNVVLNELPSLKAKPGPGAHHQGQLNTPLSPTEWRANHKLAADGELPPRLWTELYIQSALDASAAPPGKHIMSVFAQYVPTEFARGSWESRRTECAQLALESIGRYCTNIPGAVEFFDAAGPPDVEKKVGLTGGHIFQGECLPAQMWENRWSYATNLPGLYLCGACTNPGGSVIAANGRNAATKLLLDLGLQRPGPAPDVL